MAERWVTAECALLREGCDAPAEYRVYLDHWSRYPELKPRVHSSMLVCVGHLACEQHVRAARENKTADKVTRVVGLRPDERQLLVGSPAWVGQVAKRTEAPG